MRPPATRKLSPHATAALKKSAACWVREPRATRSFALGQLWTTPRSACAGRRDAQARRLEATLARSRELEIRLWYRNAQFVTIALYLRTRDGVYIRAVEIQLERYVWTIGRPIRGGAGSFGHVLEASHTDHPRAVAKFVQNTRAAARELVIADSLRVDKFRNVMPVIDRGVDGSDLIMVMPRAETSLLEYIATRGPQLSLNAAALILLDIAAALADIDGSVVHRDLKPGNVLLLNGHWCLADFGISRGANQSTVTHTWKGHLSLPYGAPELWLSDHATSAADVYSFGVMAFEMLEGARPFPGLTHQELQEQHFAEARPQLTTGPESLRALIQQCLVIDPGLRPTPADLEARLPAALLEYPLDTASRIQATARALEARVQATPTGQDAHARRRKMRSQRSAAVASFGELTQALIERARDHSAVDRVSTTDRFAVKIEMGGAVLSLSEPEFCELWSGPFEVLQIARVAVETKAPASTGRRDSRFELRRGRAHSLWFSEIDDEKNLDWLELGFEVLPGIFTRPATEPFALLPIEAATVFAPGRQGRVGLAFGPQAFSSAGRGEFANRWLQWLEEQS